MLVGRSDGAAPDSDWQWTLYTRSANESWNGPLVAGIDHTVDLLAPQQGASLAQAEVETRVRIEGVRGLADYAAIERLLQSVAGVRRANIVAADASGVAFDVTVRGGAAGLDQGLAGSTRLVRTSAAGAAAVYRYQPQGCGARRADRARRVDLPPVVRSVARAADGDQQDQYGRATGVRDVGAARCGSGCAAARDARRLRRAHARHHRGVGTALRPDLHAARLGATRALLVAAERTCVRFP